MEELKNYLLVTCEQKYIEPSGYSKGGYYNDLSIECQYQTKKACKKYKEKHSLWHTTILTKRQYLKTLETTGPHTIK